MVTGCNGSQIPLHAWINGCLLLTDNASAGSLDGMIPGFLVEYGEYGKIGNCSDITYFTYCESGPEICDGFIYINDVYSFIIVRA